MKNQDRNQHRDEKKLQLIKDHDASRANNQFETQVQELEARLIEGIEKGRHTIPKGTNVSEAARNTVKYGWIKQEIWDRDWENTTEPWWPWRHEEWPTRPYNLNWPHNMSREDWAEWGKVYPDGGEPSRPFHQFTYQISKERERIEDESSAPYRSTRVRPSKDINTRAYENVKSVWIKRGIWDNRWGLLPGTTWKHESPLKMPDDDSTPSSTQPKKHVASGRKHVDEPLAAQADGPSLQGSQRSRKRKSDAAPVDTKSSLVDDPSPDQVEGSGQGSSKRKRAAATVDPKKPGRKVKPEKSRSRPAVDIFSPRLDLQDEETQDTGTRRSTRIRTRAKSTS
ncbi:uncharacterized protein PGRI_034020 [Penicillium griseofulvum]|uniref:Uncharacterized protein n=1 Tax=Penicillium patulum TaxID=5078 RepID=A0A135L9H8_PENPA|nr:uncharacterized protein PGRI_034020 [Penicillium griseofulvum]KXG45635.1 hypothetical protein PGRI_034020 [Penicillium griseofulvum]